LRAKGPRREEEVGNLTMKQKQRMNLLKYIYPLSGRPSLEEINLKGPSENSSAKLKKTRIEILNMNGEFVYIFNDTEKVKNLTLPEGFYIMKELDSCGNTIKCSRLVY
jgi:hypothetical protein